MKYILSDLLNMRKGRIVNTDSKYIQIEFPEKNRTMKFNFEYAITKNIIKKLYFFQLSH